ncbi:MAG: HNH endonuclease [Bdellovibrionales bacterium]
MPSTPRLFRPPSTRFILGSLIRSLFTPANEYVQTNSEHNKFEHREVAESILGRKLLPGEVVHHINGKKYDNGPKNLCVMSSRDHDRYHACYDWIHTTYDLAPI